jgi:cyclic beta-1,2-glucan synthetase
MPSISPWNSQEPVREELFSVERLEEHARSLAAAQQVEQRPARGHPLAGRLADNGAILLDAYRSTVKAIDEGRAITPAAEWLIDNYHLVEKQIREIRSDLPPGYYRQLPKLAAGPFAGYPRVFGMAWAFVAHTDSRFDSEMLLRYMRAYQEVQPLTIGELWAISITLRIVLIENLRRLAQQMVHNRAARQQADGLADRLLGAGGRDPEPISVVLAGHEGVRLSEAFAVQLVHRLRDQDPRITPALTWLDQRLAAQEMMADTAVREVHRRQGASNVTVRNIITSLRLISDVDWKDLFARSSHVDDVLAPAVLSRTWISRHAISTATPSRSWRAVRTATNWTSRAARSSQQRAHRLRPRHKRKNVGAIQAIISLPEVAVTSRWRSAFAGRCAYGWCA